MSRSEPPVVGGGAKKVLYTLRSVQRIGLKHSAKALTSKNACKACGLGMGGQQGGMTNELDEFPSVCNKSVQAQLTDIQPPIPAEVFEHSIADLQALDGHELEHLGRLGFPLHKAADSDRFEPIDWDQALSAIADKLRHTPPERSFFYASGRSSNEAGFVLQLFARTFGTNNVNNCSYYCHQATSEALAQSIGTGTSTIELADLGGADLIFVIGANPASNHPRFIHQLKACRDRGGEVIIINPAKEPGLVRFAVPKSPSSLIAGGSWIASDYLQPRIGSDIALFKGLAKALIETDALDRNFIATYCSDYDVFARDIEATDWPSITSSCGIDKQAIERVAARYAQAKHTVFAWGMGMTHHLHGVDNVKQIANLALLRGMIGRPHAGLLPLRGHSNVQGIGTIGVKPVLAETVLTKMQQHFNVSFPTAAGLDTMSGMQAAANGEIDTALMMGGNLYSANPNSDWAEKALNKISTKIYLTTTLNRGHLAGLADREAYVLPVSARDEERQPTTQESMFNYVRLSDGGIERLDNVRSEVDILSELAERVTNDGIDFAAFREHQTIRETIAKIVPGMEDLASIDVAKREFHIRGRLLHTPTFNTNDQRAAFHVAEIPIAFCQAPSHDFVLSTVRSEGQFNSIVYEYRDSYRNSPDRWVVFMNSDDMQAHGLSEGDTVDLRSAQGVMQAVRVQSYDLPRGNLMAYYPEANVITSTAVDPVSKTPAFKSTRVQLEQCER